MNKHILPCIKYSTICGLHQASILFNNGNNITIPGVCFSCVKENTYKKYKEMQNKANRYR